MIISTLVMVALCAWLVAATGAWWLLAFLAAAVGWQWWQWAVHQQ